MLLSAFALIGEYFALLLFPLRLSALYVFHASTRIDWHVLAGALAMMVSAAAFGILWKRVRPATFAILWFFVTLAPVLDARWMGVYVPDRYLYIPSAGFCWLPVGRAWPFGKLPRAAAAHCSLKHGGRRLPGGSALCSSHQYARAGLAKRHHDTPASLNGRAR